MFNVKGKGNQGRSNSKGHLVQRGTCYRLKGHFSKDIVKCLDCFKDGEGMYTCTFIGPNALQM